MKGGHRNRYRNLFREGIDLAGLVETAGFTPPVDETDADAALDG